MIFQYTFFQQAQDPTPLNILLTQQCNCDNNITTATCPNTFAATSNDLLFCVDITGPSSDPTQYFYNIYQKEQMGVGEPVLVTSANNV